MNYETKFNVGDTVWLLHNNKAVFGTVWKVTVTKNGTHTGGAEQVFFEVGGRHTDEPAENLFRTKQALIASL